MALPKFLKINLPTFLLFPNCVGALYMQGNQLMLSTSFESLPEGALNKIRMFTNLYYEIN